MNNHDPDALDVLRHRVPADDSPGLSRSHYNPFMADFMKALHAHIPPIPPPDLRTPPHVEIREEHFRGETVNRAVVFLLSNGCEWALKSGHGCTMCGHIAKQTRTDHSLPADHFVTQFQAAFSSIDFSSVPVLNIFNNGSFFNDNEIPSRARRDILRMISEHRSVKKLLVECRPEFINEAVLHETKDILQGTELEIAIGLETVDDFRRAVAINKGFTLRVFEQAARIVRDNDIGLRSYVLLKPPFCSESEAIEDAVRSITSAFAMGVDSVSLEAMTVQRYTLVEYLHQRGLYRIPWLWSIVEVVRQTAHLGKVVVGLFKFYPSPDLVPRNCDLCSDAVMEAIVDFNHTRDATVFGGLDCGCRSGWTQILKDSRDFDDFFGDFYRTAVSEGLPAASNLGSQKSTYSPSSPTPSLDSRSRTDPSSCTLPTKTTEGPV